MKIIKKIIAAVCSLLFLAGCATMGPKDTLSSSDFKIKKVSRLKKGLSLELTTQNFAGSSGIDRFLSDADNLPLNQRGEEIVIAWKYSGKEPKDIMLEVQYITLKSKDIKNKTEKYPGAKKGNYKYNLVNLGGEYTAQGPIVHWKVVLKDGEQIVASKKSRLWGRLGEKKVPAKAVKDTKNKEAGGETEETESAEDAPLTSMKLSDL